MQLDVHQVYLDEATQKEQKPHHSNGSSHEGEDLQLPLVVGRRQCFDGSVHGPFLSSQLRRCTANLSAWCHADSQL
ncbi:hypothetical protein EMIT0373P_11016 [Pseudomonas chlororaphis]